jgi:outer membrane lipoprotein carrier protein
MKGRFVQTFTSSGLGVPQSEGGRFFLSRPDLMRWDYTTPERKTAVSDGTHTWLYMPEDEVVYKGSVAEWRSSGAFSILAGGSLIDEYEPVEAEAATAQRHGDVVLTVRPRKERDDLSTLVLEIEPKDLHLVSVTAVDGAGNRISVIFSDVEEDMRLDRDLFSFTPPAGARIIDQAGAPRP